MGGKKLKEHLEAVDHNEALLWMREIAAGGVPADETIVVDLHRRIVARSEPGIAGLYSPHRRRIAGLAAVFPNPLKIPDLMRDFGHWLAQADASPATALTAHFRLAAIHLFSDGNGRTARLLMNLILLRAGYVPIAIRPENRNAYLEALETGSVSGRTTDFERRLYDRLDATLSEYLAALEA